MTKRVQLTGKQVIQVAAKAETDPRTVRRYAAGLETKPAKTAAIAAALRSLGLAAIALLAGCGSPAYNGTGPEPDYPRRGEAPGPDFPDALPPDGMLAAMDVESDTRMDSRPTAPDAQATDVRPAVDIKPAADVVASKGADSMAMCQTSVVSNIVGNCPTVDGDTRYQMYPFSGLPQDEVYRCMKCADSSGKYIAVSTACRAEAQGGGVQPVFKVVCIPSGSDCASSCVPGEYISDRN